MFLTSQHLSAKHGFFTRNGGYSTGEYASLNCGLGSGDDKEIVQKNRQLVVEQLGGTKLITAYQTHSETAHIINGYEKDIEGDALVTDKLGIVLGVLTADCVPILLEDKDAGVIAAAHAGWKGARFGIIGSTIRTMQKLGAHNITAVIGPCIQQSSYEVGSDFAQAFASEGAHNGEFFAQIPGSDKFLFNLPAYVEMKLKKNHVAHVYNLNEDTLTQPEKFYSYRLGTQQGKESYGRQISAICL
jgi:YfiH family protein